VARHGRGGPPVDASAGPAGRPLAHRLALLTLADLNSNWSLYNASDGPTPRQTCQALIGGAWTTLPNNARADFQEGEAGADELIYLTEELASGTSAQITAAWQTLTTTAAHCANSTAPSFAGLSFPSYGDKTYAFATAGADGTHQDVVVVRKGDVLVKIRLRSPLDSIPLATAEGVTASAVAKT
jgi:hypothetical protein